MANVAYKALLASALILVVLLNGSGATADYPASICAKQIDDSHYAISHAIWLASAIKYGVAELKPDTSGNHPGYLFVQGLTNFTATAQNFINVYTAKPNGLSLPDQYTFTASPAVCGPKPANSASDGCTYCPKLISPPSPEPQPNPCETMDYPQLRVDAGSLTFGTGSDPSQQSGKFTKPTIASTEGIACIANYENSINPASAKAKAANDLALALYTLLGSLYGYHSAEALVLNHKRSH